MEPHATERVAAVDAAWLHMDSPTNPMVITAVLCFASPVRLAELRRWARDRVLVHDRFRQRVVESTVPLGPPRWEEDPDFDLASHVHHLALAAPGDDAELQRFVSDVASEPLDRRRPLWQAWLLDGYGDGSALVVRLHHALGDGIALVRLLLGTADEGSSAAAAAEVGLATAPAETPIASIRRGADRATTLAHLLALPADAPTPLRGELGHRKVVAWSRPIPISDVRAIARAHDAKVNDVLMACAAGALRGYLTGSAAPPVPTAAERAGLDATSPADESAERAPPASTIPDEIRALVPVYLRTTDGGRMGNHFGLVFVALPIGIADPVSRLTAVTRSMAAMKRSEEAPVAFAVLGALGSVSPRLEHLAVELFSAKASLLVTNIPGPREPIRLAGAEVDRMLVWAPVSGLLGLGMSLCSYAGRIVLGVSADARLLSDPADLVRRFEEELGAIA
ncbi:MAG: DUF1298 domain-containing protein [Deltaproteobacteria bacterium]|nr:DUF1298 domain-containing protein [Deltaproteobacteria bacterium]